jgi:hypothetical protein
MHVQSSTSCPGLSCQVTNEAQHDLMLATASADVCFDACVNSANRTQQLNGDCLGWHSCAPEKKRKHSWLVCCMQNITAKLPEDAAVHSSSHAISRSGTKSR